jgi:hypothetical protein
MQSPATSAQHRYLGSSCITIDYRLLRVLNVALAMSAGRPLFPPIADVMVQRRASTIADADPQVTAALRLEHGGEYGVWSWTATLAFGDSVADHNFPRAVLALRSASPTIHSRSSAILVPATTHSSAASGP